MASRTFCSNKSQKSGLQKPTLKKAEPGGFYRVKYRLVKRPNFTGSAISMCLPVTKNKDCYLDNFATSNKYQILQFYC